MERGLEKGSQLKAETDKREGIAGRWLRGGIILRVKEKNRKEGGRQTGGGIKLGSHS